MANPSKNGVVDVKVSVDLTDETPVYYANYAEVSSSQFDVGLSFVRIPTKLSSGIMEDVKSGGTISLPADVHVVLPRMIIAGLIEALQKHDGKKG